MAIKRELIQFVVVNNTECYYDLPLGQLNQYSINATTKYTWDITTINLSCGTATIIINGTTYTISFTPVLSSFLTSLNNLNFGFFCTETVGGNTFLYTVDDTNTYGSLSVCEPIVTTTSTTTTTTAAPTTTTTSTTTTTTSAPTTTTTSTTTTTTAAPTTTSTTTTTTAAPTTTTTSTSTTTTSAPTTTSTTTTTTAAPTTTTTSTTTTTTSAPTTTTTSTTTTTTSAPTTTTTSTTTTTTAAPTTTSTTTTTTAAPTTTTTSTTTTTTAAPTTTTTSTTTTTTAAPTTTTTSTTTSTSTSTTSTTTTTTQAPTTTTTSTTTTTTGLFFYIAQHCDNILISDTFQSTNDSIIAKSFFYNGFCWFITDTTDTGPGIPITNIYDTCVDCENANITTTTTTTTTTAAPTTTTTSTTTSTSTTSTTTSTSTTSTTSTSTTTTAALFSFLNGVISKFAPECCPGVNSVPSGTLLSTCENLALGCILLSQSTGLPFGPQLWTYQGNCYETDANGEIIAISSCETTTTTTTSTSTSTTSTTTTTTEAPTTTTTTTTLPAGNYYLATQYLNCIQSGFVDGSIIYSPTPITSPWVCGDDGFQYQLGSDTTPTTPTANYVSGANSCATLGC